MNIEKPILGIVVPCFNEEEILNETISRIGQLLISLAQNQSISENSFAFFVDDGSYDRTWDIIAASFKTNPRIKGLKLAGNAGHQNAIMAGMLALIDRVDAVITIDADLQHDLNCIPEMVKEFSSGFDLVFGVRKNRDTEPFLKRNFALLFYTVMKIFGAHTIMNHADFRLVSNKGLRFLSKYEERNLFLRGIFPLMKMKSTTVYYNQFARIGGEPKYTFLKSFSLACDGITSFSVFPLRFITFMGFLISFFSALLIVWAVYAKYQGHVVWGWTSTVVPLFFLGGIQMLALGIIGEYISKIYLETKSRPRYLIDQELF